MHALMHRGAHICMSTHACMLWHIQTCLDILTQHAWTQSTHACMQMSIRTHKIQLSPTPVSVALYESVSSACNRRALHEPICTQTHIFACTHTHTHVHVHSYTQLQKCTHSQTRTQGSLGLQCLAGVQCWSSSALENGGRPCLQPINQTLPATLPLSSPLSLPPPSLFPIALCLPLPAFNFSLPLINPPLCIPISHAPPHLC